MELSFFFLFLENRCVGPVGRTMAVRRVASNDSSVAKALGATKSSAQGRNIGTIISTTDPEKVCLLNFVVVNLLFVVCLLLLLFSVSISSSLSFFVACCLIFVFSRLEKKTIIQINIFTG